MSVTFENKTVASIIKQYPTSGHNPYLVLTTDFERYILKTIKNSYDKSSIVKEFLCNSLLKVWSLKVPPAVSLTINENLSETDFVRNNRFLNNTNSHFGSLFFEHSVDLHNLISGSGKVNLKRIKNLNDIITISLFDIWVENDDRKPSNNNILLSPSGKYFDLIPIDHAFTFSSLPLDEINSSLLSFSYNDSILYSSLGKNIIIKSKISPEWLAFYENLFYFCIRNVEANFQEICSNMPFDYSLSENEIDNVKKFLFNTKRNKEVLNLFYSIVFDIKK